MNPLDSTVFVLFFVVIGVFQKEELGSECVCEIRFLIVVCSTLSGSCWFWVGS
jgi:hypothetical protein